MKQLILILITIATISNSHAQEKKWTLNDCILYAVANSPKTNKQKQQNSIYHQNYLEAIGALLPNINANTSAGFNFGRGLDGETNTYIDVNSFGNDYNLSASLTIFDGLANYAKVKIGRISKVQGKQQLEEAKDMVAYETMEAYLNVLYYKDMVDIGKEQVDESTKSLEQLKRMEELGLKGLSDVAEAESKQAEDKYNLTRQKNLLTIGTILLKEKMNFPIDEELNILSEDYSKMIDKIIETPLSIYEGSRLFNPKAQAAESAFTIQKLNYKASKGNLMPRISMGAGISSNFFRNMDGSDYASFQEQIKNKRGEYISFTLSIPIFSGFSRSASVKKAKAQMHMAQTDRDDILRKLYSDIEQAVADTNGQVDEYEQAVKRKDAAQIAHKINQRKYEEGMIDPIILHTSSNRLMQAKAEELNAKYKYHLKHKLVSYYMGEPLYVEK
ncbi:TolC family protein [Dysgonomonas sp. Marseille-P4677]|uniref:TolC family protein n=1 Tax=Dysgonomonas sp. Marseille-P4677 TaxID=2364790 RepID=UPI001912C2E4|nr:TolC family protein [Dysgonomonas sp. Marseille-P4677]MBK5720939.1 TolC family protein [Dysgonomonas sp. Marseille-P4677]